MLAEHAHKVSHHQSLGNRYLLDEARHLLLSPRKDIRRHSLDSNRPRLFRRKRPAHPRPHPHLLRRLLRPLPRSSQRSPHAPTVIIIHAHDRPRMAVPDNMVVQRAHPAQRVHPRDRLVRDRPARDYADVAWTPRAPGDSAAVRVRAHVGQHRVGRDVQRLLLLPTRVVSAPAVAHDVQHDQPRSDRPTGRAPPMCAASSFAGWRGSMMPSSRARRLGGPSPARYGGTCGCSLRLGSGSSLGLRCSNRMYGLRPKVRNEEVKSCLPRGGHISVKVFSKSARGI